jgi:O-glycosyl hydrolase
MQPQSLRNDPDDVRIPSITIDAGRQFQTIEGFGGALTESSAMVWSRMKANSRRKSLMRTLIPAPETATQYAVCTLTHAIFRAGIGHAARRTATKRSRAFR